MEEKCSKVLLENNQQEVNKKSNQINNEFNSILQEYERKEKDLVEENLKLKKEIEEVYKRLKTYRDLKKKLMEMLYESHIKAVKPIYNSEKKLDEMMEYKSEIVKKLERKSIDINNLIVRIKSTMED